MHYYACIVFGEYYTSVGYVSSDFNRCLLLQKVVTSHDRNLVFTWDDKKQLLCFFVGCYAMSPTCSINADCLHYLDSILSTTQRYRGFDNSNFVHLNFTQKFHLNEYIIITFQYFLTCQDWCHKQSTCAINTNSPYFLGLSLPFACPIISLPNNIFCHIFIYIYMYIYIYI